MKVKSRLNFLIIILCCSVFYITGLGASDFSDVFAHKRSIEDEQPKFALLVGISKYKNTKLNQIDGCENNVPLLADTLIKDYGFREENVFRLLNEQATYDSIISNFHNKLIENARKSKESGKEAVILYYFCGHGSQYPDQDKDEADGLDETFVAYDSRTADVFDILDDQIDDLKAELRQYTDNTTLIFESCHSGTGSRTDSIQDELVSEETDMDDRKRKPYVRKFPPSSDKDALTYVELAASASTNTAKSETAAGCKCDRPYSLMTKALVQGLKRASYSTTYRGLMREVSDEVAVLSAQDPQVEGDRDAVLFRGGARRSKSYIEIEKILSVNRIIIRAGAVHGLKTGSQVSIYSSDANNNSGKDGWLASGIVTEVSTTNAVVQLPSPEENPKVSEIKISSHVVLASPIFGGGSVLVILDPQTGRTSKTSSDRDAKLRRGVEEALKAEGLLDTQIIRIAADEPTLLASQSQRSPVVSLRKGLVGEVFTQLGTKRKYPMVPRLNATTCAEEPFPPTKEVYYLDDGEPGGPPLFGVAFDPEDQNISEKIADALRNFALQNNLRRLDNAASDLSKSIEFELQSVPNDAVRYNRCENGTRKYGVVPERYTNFKEIKGYEVTLGSSFRLRIRNVSGERNRKLRNDQFAAGEPLYVSVIVLTGKGEIHVRTTQAKEPIADGGDLNLPFRTSEPIGTERFEIVVSRVPADFSFLESAEPESKRSPRSPLDQIMGEVLTQSGNMTRDNGTMLKDEPDQWGVIHLNLTTVKTEIVSPRVRVRRER